MYNNWNDKNLLQFDKYFAKNRGSNKYERTCMKRVPTYFLRAAVLAIGAAVLALCVFALPIMWTEVADDYPDVAYALYGILITMYVAAVPFFMGLYQTLLLLNFIDKNKAFSTLSAAALRRISYCASAISAVYVLSSPFFYVWAEAEDAPGVIIIGIVLAGASLTVAVFAAVLGRLFREAIAMKSEHDLTV
jgi:hypothetical protein